MINYRDFSWYDPVGRFSTSVIMMMIRTSEQTQSFRRTFLNSSSSTLKCFGLKSFSRSQGMRCDGAGNCIKLQKSCKNIWMMNEKDKFPGMRKIMKQNSWKFIVIFTKLSSFSRFLRNHVEIEALDLETIGSS